jgi:phytoene synthase
MSELPDAASITRASRSNLALAFVSLPPDKRRDITALYAFCRVVDDIGDAPGVEAAAKRAGLDAWERALGGPSEGEPPLAPEIRSLAARRSIDARLLREIIAGVRMDVDGVGYATWEELRQYCWRVASAVGLASIEIFGYTDPGTRGYAESLGLALQLTNIVRDVAVDLRENGRVYLPSEDLARFGLGRAALEAGPDPAKFLALMRFEAERAEGLFAEAERRLPAADRRAMVPAEIMRRVYRRLLARMRADGFKVFNKRYQLPKWEKAALVGGSVAAAWFAR